MSAPPAAPGQSVTSAADRRVNILLVDDQPANLLALEAILSDLDANLVTARSGQEALGCLLRQDFSVVLLDIQMQGMDGFETAKLIRGRKKSRSTPIIFLTAYDSHRLPVEAAYALGAVDYLVKPLVPVILRAKVSGFVELYQKSAEIKAQAEKIQEMERREFERKLAEERQRAEEVLRDSEQRFSRFMQHLPGLAWIKDLAGRYVYVNDAAEKVFGSERANLYGKDDTQIFPADIAAKFQENDRLALASVSGVQVIEQVTHDDGLVHYSLVNKFPILGVEGKPTLVGGMAIDITDRLRAENALKDANRRKDEFLAMLAHELRNPLAPIRNALYILKTPGAGADVLRRAQDMMERQVHHLVRLVDDLLDVSRIMRDRIELRKERLSLATVVARGVETAQPIIQSQGHHLTLVLPAEEVWLEADQVRLAQVVGNLLNNAAKYTDKGGRIFLTAERQDAEAVVSIRDTGVGIDRDMLPHIFDLFVQGERSVAQSQGGMGVGLALVRKLVEMHGGRVEARSEGPGCGSEFIVRLPIPDRTRHAEEMEGDRRQRHTDQGGHDEAQPPSVFRILIVDDNRDAADSLAMMLRLERHEVRVATDGRSALEVMPAFRPDLAFLDIGMPGMDGYELCRRIRAQGQGPRLVVALTGWGQADDRRRSEEAGFDRHLVKPVEPHSLQRLLTHPKLTGGEAPPRAGG